MTYVMVSGLLGLAASLFSMKAGAALLGGAHYILGLYKAMGEGTQRLPGASLVVGRAVSGGHGPVSGRSFSGDPSGFPDPGTEAEPAPGFPDPVPFLGRERVFLFFAAPEWAVCRISGCGPGGWDLSGLRRKDHADGLRQQPGKGTGKGLPGAIFKKPGRGPAGYSIHQPWRLGPHKRDPVCAGGAGLRDPHRAPW